MPARPIPASPRPDLATVIAVARDEQTPEAAADAVRAALAFHRWPVGTWQDHSPAKPFVVVEVSARHEMVLVLPTGIPGIEDDVYDLSVAEAIDFAAALADGRELARGDGEALRVVVAAIAIKHP